MRYNDFYRKKYASNQNITLFISGRKLDAYLHINTSKILIAVQIFMKTKVDCTSSLLMILTYLERLQQKTKKQKSFFW